MTWTCDLFGFVSIQHTGNNGPSHFLVFLNPSYYIMSSLSGFLFPSYDTQSYEQGHSLAEKKNSSSGNSTQFNLKTAFLQPSSSAGFSGSEIFILTASHATPQNEAYLSMYTQCMRLQCEVKAQV